MSTDNNQNHSILFPRLDAQSLQTLQRKGTLRKTTAGEVLFNRETLQHGLFVVLSGSIDLVGVANGMNPSSACSLRVSSRAS